MISKNFVIKYCKDFTKIENYDKAIADTTQIWHCHHRAELVYTAKELKEKGMYYNVLPCDLIFLTHSEHRRLHMSFASNKFSMKNKHHSIEARKKISKNNYNKTEEGRKRMSIRSTGNTNVRGMHWYNNGVVSTMAFECPEGFVEGQLRTKRG